MHEDRFEWSGIRGSPTVVPVSQLLPLVLVRTSATDRQWYCGTRVPLRLTWSLWYDSSVLGHLQILCGLMRAPRRDVGTPLGPVSRQEHDTSQELISSLDPRSEYFLQNYVL